NPKWWAGHGRGGGNLVAVVSERMPIELLRANLLSHLERNPGQSISVIARAFRLHHSSATYHLRELAGQGLVVVRREGRVLRHWKNGSGHCPPLKELGRAMADDRDRRAMGLLATRGRVTVRDLEALGFTGAGARYWIVRATYADAVAAAPGIGEWRMFAKRRPCIEKAIAGEGCAGCPVRWVVDRDAGRSR
ncbi:MAG: MarR family transcriptional regulator, partial [Methanobacteriota archaeon]